MLLGLGDYWVAAVYLLCMISALIGAVYGFINWNREGEDRPEL